ncbi:MAG: benzoate-CoA ligase family protein [Myxococcota bacterium]|jgi:benzoate-CoA ligase family protein
MSDELNIANTFLFDRLAEGMGERVALRYGDVSYTYVQVADRARRVAAALAAAGIRREERVYIVLPDNPAFAWTFFGTLAGGHVVTMGNPASPTDSLESVLSYTRATCLVTVPSVAERLAPAIQAAPGLRSVLLVPEVPTGGDCEGECSIPAGLPATTMTLSDAMLSDAMLSDAIAAHPEPSCFPLATRRDEVAIWLFTSGSTGHAKACVHTHRDFAFNSEVYAKGTVRYQRDDVTVSVPRLYFGYATGTNLMFPFAVGATVGLFSERPTPETLTDAIERYAPTVITNVPTMMGKLLNYDEQLRREGKPGIDMSAIRFNLSAGEALPPALLERFQARWPCDVYDGIGSAEMFHIYASNRPGDIKPGSLGRVVDGYTIKILAEDAAGPGAPELPAGETGVMWVKGDSVALCYHEDREKSWQTFHGHWCRTGDLFRKDAEGYLWFSGRADSLLKVSGQWVAPLEVEQCLMTHPAVNIAVVIGAEREGLLRVKAFVVLRDSAREQSQEALRASIRQHVKDHLAPHKAPQWTIFSQELPRNDRGKIDRKTLVAQEKAGTNPWA